MTHKNVGTIISFFSILCFMTGAMPEIHPLEYHDSYGAITDFFAATAGDDEGLTVFRSLNVSPGGRAEALGTAYTGLADDISYIEYNPAGSAVLEETELAFFHNAWIADSALETIAWTTRYDHLGMGAAFKCFYVPFSEYNIFGERVSGGYYSETTVTANIAYNFLAGYDFKGIAAGLNIKGSYRGIPDFADNNTDKIVAGSGLEQSGAAVMADLGMLLRFNAAKFYVSRETNLRVGLSLNNIGVALTGFAHEVQLDDPLPSRIAVGAAYKPFRPLTISLDYRQPFNLYTMEFFHSWSAALGIDVAVTDFFSAQTGFLVQGGNPRISLGGSFTVRRMIVNANYTLDLTSTVAPLNRFSLSVKMELGDKGRALVLRQIDELYAQGLRAYTEERLEEAAAYWQECIRLDPGFDPAKNGLTVVQTAIMLRQRIIDVQTLD
jgi:hypothetical protein